MRCFARSTQCDLCTELIASPCQSHALIIVGSTSSHPGTVSPWHDSGRLHHQDSCNLAGFDSSAGPTLLHFLGAFIILNGKGNKYRRANFSNLYFIMLTACYEEMRLQLQFQFGVTLYNVVEGVARRSAPRLSVRHDYNYWRRYFTLLAGDFSLRTEPKKTSLTRQIVTYQ